MGTMYGADVAQLRELARMFDAKANQLDTNRMTVGNAIQISAWVGPVAVRFRHEWDSDYSRKVHDAALRLRDAAGKLRANADDQERTSAASGAGLGRVLGDALISSLPKIDGHAGPAGSDTHASSDTVQSSNANGSSAVGAAALPPYDKASSQQQFDSRSTTVGGDLARGGENDGQCTSWAYFRRAQMGLSLPHGNGSAMAASLHPSSDPTIGAVASTTSNANHVMVVEEILSDSPRTIRVSEMNYGKHVQGQPNYITTGTGRVSDRTLQEVSPGHWKCMSDGLGYDITFGQ